MTMAINHRSIRAASQRSAPTFRTSDRRARECWERGLRCHGPPRFHPVDSGRRLWSGGDWVARGFLECRAGHRSNALSDSRPGHRHRRRAPRGTAHSSRCRHGFSGQPTWGIASFSPAAFSRAYLDGCHGQHVEERSWSRKIGLPSCHDCRACRVQRFLVSVWSCATWQRAREPRNSHRRASPERMGRDDGKV